MYMYVNAYVCTCIYDMCVCVYINVCIFVCASMTICMCVCTSERIRVDTCLHRYAVGYLDVVWMCSYIY